MKGFAEMVQGLRAERRVPLKKMQAFAGKGKHVASLLYGWRPFIDELWAAIYLQQGRHGVW